MNIRVFFPDVLSTILIHKVSFNVEEPGYSLNTRYHKTFEILHCWEGEITEWVNEKELTFSTGDWLFLSSGVRHRTLNHSGRPFSFFAIHFDIDDPQIRRVLKSYQAEQGYIPKEIADQSSLYQLMKNIESCMFSSLIHNQPTKLSDAPLNFPSLQQLPYQANILLIIHEVMNILRNNLFKPQASKTKAISGSELDIANKIATRLDEYVYGSIPINFVAQNLNLSRSQCTKVFTKVYGMSPRQYLSTLKIRKSKELLVQTDLTVGEIAGKLGFSSVHHFGKQFRRWTGFSPTKFRPKHVPQTIHLDPAPILPEGPYN